MLRTHITTRLRYEAASPCHIVLRLRPTDGACHRLLTERFSATGLDGAGLPFRTDTGGGNVLHRVDLPYGGLLDVTYEAEVAEIMGIDGADPRDHPVVDLPGDVLTWLMPSRYCESDRMADLALECLGQPGTGVQRVQGVIDWVRSRIVYEVGASGPSTTAMDALQAGRGVCRDFAQVCVAMCRALNLPARMVFGYALFDEPPQDFHAIFEVWLGRWVRFDPTGLCDPRTLIAIAHGHDAAELPFATLFGAAQMVGMDIGLVQRDADTGDTVQEATGQPVLELA